MAAAFRSTREVFDDHLRLALAGAVEEDLARNYADEVVVLMGEGVHRGKPAVRELAVRLGEELPQVRFRYTARVVAGEFAFLEWTAESPRAQVKDGADSFVIRKGQIVAQTIHYTVRIHASSS